MTKHKENTSHTKSKRIYHFFEPPQQSGDSYDNEHSKIGSDDHGSHNSDEVESVQSAAANGSDEVENVHSATTNDEQGGEVPQNLHFTLDGLHWTNFLDATTDSYWV